MAAALFAACLAPPRAPERRERTVVLDTAEDDRKVGEAASRAVEAQVGVVKDPALERYLQDLGTRLVRFAPPQPFAYEFRVIDQWSPNAFALPGGHIFVSRGLLVLTNSEDELACVVGHEITHAAERHAASRQAFVEQLRPFALQLPRIATIAAYARDQERRADLGGQRICSAAGYDPRALSVFLQSLDAIDRLQMGQSRIPTFLDTHPGTPERVGSTAVFAATLPAPPERDPVRGREAYLEHLDGLILGADPSEGVVVGSRFLHPDLGIGLSFPSGWAIANTPAAVVAISPKRDARFALEDAGPGDEPAVAAAPFVAKLREVQAVSDFEGPQQTRCCRAYVVRGRVETKQGPLAGQVTWIALGGRVYRLSSVFAPIATEKYADRARQFVRSFHPLDASERALVQVDRLHLVRARAGETLAALFARTGNVYTPHATALANGLPVDTVLAEGQLVKVGVRGPYASAGREPERPPR